MDCKNNVKASVLIFTYNRKQFIKNALDSVIASQKGIDNVEIIISTCIPRDELELDPVPPNVKYLVFPYQTLYGEQLIETVKKSNGEILLFLEDDDVFEHNKINIVLNLFEDSSNVIAVKNEATDVISEGYIDESVFNKKHTELHHISKSRDYNIDLITPRDIYDLILSRIVVNPSTLSVRRSVILENEDVIRNNDPMDILISAAILNSHGFIKYLDRNLTAYRLHSSNDSHFARERDADKLRDRMLKTTNKYLQGLNGAYDVINLKPMAKLLIQYFITQEKFSLLILTYHSSRGVFIKSVFNSFAIEVYLRKKPSFVKIGGLSMIAKKLLFAFMIAKKLLFAFIYILNRNLAYKIYIKMAMLFPR